MVLMAMVLVFSIASCGLIDEDSKAKGVVDSFFKAVSDMDMEKMNTYLVKEDQFSEKDIEEAKKMKEDEKQKIFLDVMKGLTAKYVSGEIPKDAKDVKEAEYKYSIKSKDFGEIVGKIMSEKMAGKEDEQIVKEIKIDEIKDKEVEAPVKLVKEGEDWKISNSKEIMGQLIGLPTLP